MVDNDRQSESAVYPVYLCLPLSTISSTRSKFTSSEGKKGNAAFNLVRRAWEQISLLQVAVAPLLSCVVCMYSL